VRALTHALFDSAAGFWYHLLSASTAGGTIMRVALAVIIGAGVGLALSLISRRFGST
jgi:hypothetical protein